MRFHALGASFHSSSVIQSQPLKVWIESDFVRLHRVRTFYCRKIAFAADFTLTHIQLRKKLISLTIIRPELV